MSDPPGGFFSQPRLLRTPFGRMLQHLHIRPNTPSVDDVSEQPDEYSMVPQMVGSNDPTSIAPSSDPPPVHRLPRVTESVVVPAPRGTPINPTVARHRPDPDASLSSDPLSAYSPYTRAVIMQGGDQSVYEDSISFADTIEAAEEAMDYYGNLSSETLQPGISPIPSEIETPHRRPLAYEPLPPTPPSPSGPLPPPTVTLEPSEVYVRYQATSSSVLAGTIVQADYRGVSHPYLRGYIGPNRSTQHSRKHFYVVKQGWNPGIYTSWGEAWVRIADFRALTHTAPEFAGASTYAAAVRYLGWDPRLVPPRGPFPPAASVQYTQGPWPRPPSTVSPEPSTPSPSVPTVTASFAQRLESALAAQSVPAATISRVVRDLHPAGVSSLALPSPVVGLGGTPTPSAPSSASSSLSETPNGKLRREQKGFPEFPATAFTGEIFDQYYESVRNILHMYHWHLNDGTTIPGHTTTPDNPHDKQVSQQLHYHSVISIQAKRNPVALGVLSELQSDGCYGDGILLLERLRAIAYPTTTSSFLQDFDTSSFLQDFDTWNRLSHKNKEDLTTFYRRAKEARVRLQTHKYEITDLQFRVRFYYLVVKGPYGHAMKTLEEEFKCGRIDLFNMTTQELFIAMHQEFREQCYTSRSTMEVMDGKHGGGSIKGRRVSADTEEDPDGYTTVGAQLSGDAARQQHREYKCLVCKILRKGNKKGGRGIHPTWKCPILKECGFTTTYDYEKDSVLNPEGRASSFPSGRKASGDQHENSVAGRRAQSTPSDPVVVDTVTSSEDAGDSCKLIGPSRLLCDIPSHTSCPSVQNADSVVSDDDWSETDSVGRDDHSTDWLIDGRGSDSNVLVDEFLSLPSSSSEEPLTCRRSPSSRRGGSGRSLLCPDSGATADMFWDRRLFVDSDYEPLSTRHVEMGDGRRVPIAGRGTVEFVVDGHRVRLADCYHVPDLDVHLLSIRVHRRRGPGCSFLADDHGMYLTFPSFVLSVDDGSDPLIAISPIPPNSSSSIEYSDTHGSVLYGRALRVVGRRVQTRSQTRSDTEAASPSPLPSCYVADTGGTTTHRRTPFELHRLFGNRNLPDFSLLGEVGTGLKVVHAQESTPTVGDFTTIDQRRRGPSRRRERCRLDLVGMDIGYGSGISPGGYNYCLTLVDSATRMVFSYGLTRLTGGDLQDAFWRFLIDAGGIPKVVQCDFDSRFLGGRMAAFLQSLRIKVRSAAPRRQSSNGLVERTWRTGVRMARSFLAEAKLPRIYWYWALREAFHRMNLLPVQVGPSKWSTPLQLFYERPADFRVLFPFGSIGYFHRPSDGKRRRQTFESRSFVGVAVGRSDFCNGLLFYNPDLQTFSVSSDYSLDVDRGVSDAFPSLVYDGGLQLSLWARDNGLAKSIYPPGTPVYWRMPGDSTRYQGRVLQVPTNTTTTYTVAPTDHASTDPLEIEPDSLWGVNELKQGPSRQSATNSEEDEDGTSAVAVGWNDDPLRPTWLRPSEPVTLQVADQGYVQGELQLDASGEWEFVGRDTSTNNQRTVVSLPSLGQTYRNMLQEGTLVPGWTLDPRASITGRFVSAVTLDRKSAPGSLMQLPTLSGNDKKIWTDSYGEEHGSLVNMDVFDEIDEKTYKRYQEAGFTAIPTMNVFTIKPDEMGNPYRAKSRIVILGNLEERVWTNSDRYAPVLQSTSCRLLISMAVECGRVAKQGDCKNAFCQPELPEDEIVICSPPRGCPISRPNIYWKLKKTLYGLRRSPRHWYDKFVEVLVGQMGFKKCVNDPCVLIGESPNGTDPVYVGVYVDDFVYFSADPESEKWFETTLGGLLTVDFMGAVSYFLGCRYQWYRTANDGVGVHISQPGFIEQFLQKFGMSDCTPAPSPYRSGLPIDRIPSPTENPDNNPLVGPYRSLMGGLTWLSISTRPDIAVAHKLLSRHVTNPSPGHFEAAKHVLRYLRGTTDRGISFTEKSNDNAIHGYISWPPNTPSPSHAQSEKFTDSNWGPQDASKPLPEEEETRTVSDDECKSLQGALILRTGGLIWWKIEREERCSRSSCEAEIKSMDLVTKEAQHIHYLMEELNLPDVHRAIPVYNDNRGAVDWSSTGAITKRLRHLNMRQVAIRDAINAKEVAVYHIPGKVNPADLLTKEHRDATHFRELRDILVPSEPGVGGVGNEQKDALARRGRATSHEEKGNTAKTMTKRVSWADVVRRNVA